MMYWYGPGFGAWGYVLMTASMVLFWGLLIAGVIALVRYSYSGSGRPPGRSESVPTRMPEQVLGERFARGEIDEDEYRRRLDTLCGTRTVTGA
jgi:putative membrane protein